MAARVLPPSAAPGAEATTVASRLTVRLARADAGAGPVKSFTSWTDPVSRVFVNVQTMVLPAVAWILPLTTGTATSGSGAVSKQARADVKVALRSGVSET